MKLFLVFALFFLVSGCASSGYNPHYIVSDILDEEGSPSGAAL